MDRCCTPFYFSLHGEHHLLPRPDAVSMRQATASYGNGHPPCAMPHEIGIPAGATEGGVSSLDRGLKKRSPSPEAMDGVATRISTLQNLKRVDSIINANTAEYHV